MMYFLLYLLLTLTVCSSIAPYPGYSLFKRKFDNLAKQINEVELQLNNSLTQILEKINDNTLDILGAISASHISQKSGSSKSSVRPVNALVIIDVQNDFINGSLALRNCPSKHNGEEVVPVINKLLNSIDFGVVVYSHDWHPTNHISFFDNLALRANLLARGSPPLEFFQLYSTATFEINNLTHMSQTLWPRHCVQNTIGAKLHPDLEVIKENNEKNIKVIHIQKGTKPDIDSYSAFWDNSKLSETKLHKELQEQNVTRVFLTGLATDWCVYSTAIHALEYGYETFIVEDGCRGVDETTITQRLRDFKQKKGYVIQSNSVVHYI